jgi:hypothetical protein
MQLWMIINGEGVPLRDPYNRYSAVFFDLDRAQAALERAQLTRDALCKLVTLSTADLKPWEDSQ